MNVTPQTDTPDRVVAAVSDLIFGSRIRAVADQRGTVVDFARSADAVLAKAEGARLVLLDLEARWLDAPAVIRQLKRATPTGSVPVIGFASHVLGDLLLAAREAGADRVLARSAFVRELPELLR